MPAQTIDEVITRLESIIAHAITTNSRVGYFAALYHKVTSRVKQGIQNGQFEDGQRMEHFDVLFANRYLDAYGQWINKQYDQMSLSWRTAFEMTKQSSILILQQLFLGMNAHINLDLGIAVTALAKTLDQPLESLHNDFNDINTVLAALTYQVISELDQVSPLLSLAGLHSKNDSLFIQFELDNARDGAWCFAEELYSKDAADANQFITTRDKDIALLADSIAQTKGLLRFTVWIIHLFEDKVPAKVTAILRSYKKAYLHVNGEAKRKNS